MNFDVYTREDGAYILFPTGSGALADAESLHGHLEYCETILEADYPFPAIWDTVRAELERHSHALLPRGIGRRLMGLDCEDDHAGEARRAASA